MTASGKLDPLEITLVEPTEKNINVLKKMNAHIFPVAYHDKFYADCMSCVPFTIMALYTDFIIGGICCRLEKQPDGKAIMYMMTLGVLAPYRRRGVGVKLLNHTMKLAKEDPNIDEVYLHVQTSNDDAIEFYKHYGFTYKETIKDYYKRIEPPDCYVYTRGVNDWKDLEPPSSD